MKRILVNFALALVLVSGLNYTSHPDRTGLRELILPSPGFEYLSPTAMVPSPDGKKLYIACATANNVVAYDIADREIVKKIAMPGQPSGLALSADGQRLYVTTIGTRSKVCVVNTASGKIRATLLAGHTAIAPVLSPDGKLLYVCNRFNDSIWVFDLDKKKDVARIQVDREPVASALTPDGSLLFVANHLHNGAADKGVVAANVSVVDTKSKRLIKSIQLTNGSGLLNGVCVSPDGKYVAVTHILARFHLPTTTVTHGWMNDNTLSLIRVSDLKLLTTVLLDNDNRGAANPWAVAWSPDGKFICVSHAGTHEVSVIDAPGLLAKIEALPERLETPSKSSLYSNAAQVIGDVPNDLEFLTGLRARVKLHGRGPRCLALVGGKVFVGNYFSDSLSILALDCNAKSTATIQLALPMERTSIRKGEMYFNDATLCYQGWQSCASCHSSDARVDGMNWDLLNDGMGNPKNVKSLLFSFQTPPVMSMGVRADAAAAIRAGIRHILFAPPREEVASAIDDYVKNLQPLISPYLLHGQFSDAAARGRKLFFSDSVGCATCHSPPLFTDLKPHATGTGKFDQRTDEFYTPTLIEAWRTAPYLHDGSAPTIRDLISRGHGKNRNSAGPAVSERQIDDLTAFVLSL